MEKKAWFQEVSLAEVFETMVDLEGARAALRFLSGKGAGPLSPDAPPPPEVEAELQAFAEALTPERLSGAIRLAPEGVHLFGGAFFLPYGDGWAYGEGLQRAHTWAAWMWSLGHYEETWEVLERLLPGKKKGTPQLPRRRHPAYRLLLSYGDYLALTHTPRDPVAWAWLLDLDPSRVREVVDRALAQWLRDEEASRDFREAFQPWEVLRHLGNPAAYLHARRLLALDGERFFREWRRHPEALLSFLSLGHVSLDWEAYRGLLRRGYALLRAQGWGRGGPLAPGLPEPHPGRAQGTSLRGRAGAQGASLPASLPPPPGGDPAGARAGAPLVARGWTTRIGASSWASWRRTRTPRPPRRRPWWRCCGPGAAGRGGGCPPGPSPPKAGPGGALALRRPPGQEPGA
ncbi:hypothetical protein [Thermus thermophilus]|uniref:hypothetical protein n=1 Tax=Thermus thermophilus TaxID=274 RepID=UPI001FCDAADD|nr:hypothetical protein [Thermus thermophilus]BDG22697.1 hypothetical protein TthSNM17_23590 [Thermus thermophilus]